MTVQMRLLNSAETIIDDFDLLWGFYLFSLVSYLDSMSKNFVFPIHLTWWF